MDELLRQFWEPLVAYAQEIVSGRDEAEDVVQEVVLRIWERRSEWTPTDRLQSFLYRSTRNEALNQRRSWSTRRRAMDRIRQFRRTAPPSTALSDDSALARQIREAIDKLPPRRREIFVLARFHGQSHREIAEVLDISPQTVSNQMSSALSQLRNDLRAIYAELRDPR